jgi:prevent-host-death family protein
MDITAGFLTKLVPITQFNRGQASKIFERVNTEKELIVLKNNQPSAVILSTDEYTRLSEIEENYALLLEATKRLAINGGNDSVSAKEVYKQFGITESELDEMEDVEIE